MGGGVYFERRANRVRLSAGSILLYFLTRGHGLHERSKCNIITTDNAVHGNYIRGETVMWPDDGNDNN